MRLRKSSRIAWAPALSAGAPDASSPPRRIAWGAASPPPSELAPEVTDMLPVELSLHAFAHATPAKPAKAAKVAPEPVTEGFDEKEGAEAQRRDRVTLMVSTALVYGFLSARNLVQPETLSAEMAKSARQLAGVRDARGRGFADLVELFEAMLYNANIPRGKQWLVRVRLWQLILLQHADGHWTPSSGAAFALQAHSEEDAEGGHACPLTCNAAELEASMPPGLEAEGGRDAALAIWTTALVIATLERFRLCWSATDGGGGSEDGEKEGGDEGGAPRTIVDKANVWLHRQRFTMPPPQSKPAGETGCARVLFSSLFSALADDDDDMVALEEDAGGHHSGLKVAASRQVRVWAERCLRAMARLRAAERPRPEHYSLMLQRSAGEIARAALTKHETFRRGVGPCARGGAEGRGVARVHRAKPLSALPRAASCSRPCPS